MSGFQSSWKMSHLSNKSHLSLHPNGIFTAPSNLRLLVNASVLIRLPDRPLIRLPLPSLLPLGQYEVMSPHWPVRHRNSHRVFALPLCCVNRVAFWSLVWTQAGKSLIKWHLKMVKVVCDDVRPVRLSGGWKASDNQKNRALGEESAFPRTTFPVVLSVFS